MSEWNLSDKKVNPYSEGDYKAYLLVTDVKEFIRRLKERYTAAHFYIHKELTDNFKKEIDKLAGEKLIEETVKVGRAMGKIYPPKLKAEKKLR